MKNHLVILTTLAICFFQPVATYSAPAPLPPKTEADQRAGPVEQGEIRRFEGRSMQPFRLSLSEDGKRLLTAEMVEENDGKTMQLRLWDVATGRRIKSFRDSEITVSSDGPKVEYHLRTGASLLPLLLPDGLAAISTCGENVFHLIDLSSGTEVRRFEGHTGLIRALALSKDGRRVLSGGSDKTIRLWEVATGKQISLLKPVLRQDITDEVAIISLAFSPDGKRALSGSDWDGSVRLWDLENKREIASASPQKFAGVAPDAFSHVSALAFTPDGKQAVLGAHAGIWLWDFTAAKAQLLATDDLPSAPVFGMSVSADGTRAVSVHERYMLVWDLASRRSLRTVFFDRLGNRDSAVSAAFLPQSKQFITGHNYSIRVWETDLKNETEGRGLPLDEKK